MCVLFLFFIYHNIPFILIYASKNNRFQVKSEELGAELDAEVGVGGRIGMDWCVRGCVCMFASGPISGQTLVYFYNFIEIRS